MDDGAGKRYAGGEGLMTRIRGRERIRKGQRLLLTAY